MTRNTEWPIKLYYVYYLPHARNGSGKVGMTGACIRDRITDNLKDGNDIARWRLLYATYDFHDALRKELEFQIALDCVETHQSGYIIEKLGRLGRPSKHSNQTNNTRVQKNAPNKRRVCVTNTQTNEQLYFESISDCERYLGITPGKGILSGRLRRIGHIYTQGRLKDLAIDIY